ncbi:hypothetical protein [Blastococcus sp. LR1]|uniref:hypothetical protein n=1 Tax=Blastococcus sp. LR1 TaxID=2877000 RepID=UPI001CC901B4|nr:hypothetical protein [Blastococcus sp. LR1]MCA0143427.1 hypothetical protein [Blastococcus sp. LR1]
MLTGLLASARELRNPLTVGYSAVFSCWIVAGEELAASARSDQLGARLLVALDSIGPVAQVALVTFLAAIVGSVLWNAGVARLVRFLAAVSRHPDWPKYIDEAKEAVRAYEQYRVTTYKGSSGGKPSSFDKEHTVPSPRWGEYLHSRVDERERKAAEMSFRVTLAVALVPIAVTLGVEGGGSWWWAIVAVPFVWLDVASMKYTTLRTVRRYELEDLAPKLERARNRLAEMDGSVSPGGASPQSRAELDNDRREQAERLRANVNELEARFQQLSKDETRRLSRLFAFLEGKPAD